MLQNLYTLLDVPLVPLLSRQYIPYHINKRNHTRFKMRASIDGDSLYQTQSPRDDFCFLYLHGWSASVLETAPLCQILAKLYNARVLVPSLERHRALSAPMDYIYAEEWLYSAIRALHMALSFSKKVILIGCSTGASLALLLSAGRFSTQAIICTLLLAPNLGVIPSYIDMTRYSLIYALYNHVLRYKRAHIKGDLHNIYRQGTGARLSSTKKHLLYSIDSIKKAQYLLQRIPYSSLRPMSQLVSSVWNIVKKRPHRYRTPTLVIANTHDPSVSYKKIKGFFSRYPAPIELNTSIIGKTPGIHVPAGDFFAPQYTHRVIQEIQRYITYIGYP